MGYAGLGLLCLHRFPRLKSLYTRYDLSYTGFLSWPMHVIEYTRVKTSGFKFRQQRISKNLAYKLSSSYAKRQSYTTSLIIVWVSKRRFVNYKKRHNGRNPTFLSIRCSSIRCTKSLQSKKRTTCSWYIVNVLLSTLNIRSWLYRIP